MHLKGAAKEDEELNDASSSTTAMATTAKTKSKRKTTKKTKKRAQVNTKNDGDATRSNTKKNKTKKSSTATTSTTKPSKPAATTGKERRTALHKSRLLNQQIVQCTTATQVLQLLQTSTPLHQPAAGHILNSVNFSTALHRLARHSVGQATTRATVLADPRFALFLASLAEALQEATDASSSIRQTTKDSSSSGTGSSSNNNLQFQSRELSNIGWALAKLKLPPPQSVIPLLILEQNGDISDDKKKKKNQVLLTAAQAVRQAVLQAAASRRQQQTQDVDAAGSSPKTWIPAVSQLAGHLLDAIGQRVLDMTKPGSSSSSSFQLQELSNVLWAWATAGRADPVVVETVLQRLIQQQQENLIKLSKASNDNDKKKYQLRPQEWSNSMWAIATAQVYQGHEVFLEYVAHLLQTYPDFLYQFKPQECSNTVWGVATLLANKQDAILTSREERAALSILRSVAKYVQQRAAGSFKTQELSNTAWAMATLGFGLDALKERSLNNNYVVLESDDSKGDYKLMIAALDEILKAALPLLPRFRSQELNNLAWSLARLLDVDHKTEAVKQVLDGIGRQLTNPKRQVTSQDIGTTLWSLASLEHVNEDLFRSLGARLRSDKAHTYKPQELSNTVWAFATCLIEVDDKDAFDTSLVPESMRPQVRDPVTACLAIASKELMRRPHQFKSQEIKDVLWGHSKMGIRHPALFRFVAMHLIGENREGSDARGFDEFSSQGLGNMAWAFARQAQLAEEVNQRIKGNSLLSNSGGRLAVYTTSFFDIGEALLQRFFAGIAEAYLRLHNQLQKGKPQDLTNSAWAFAVLGLKQSSFLEAMNKEVCDRTSRFVKGESEGMTHFTGQELANFLWALATLNMPPGDLLRSLTSYIRALCRDENGVVTAAGIARFFKRQELANIAWACACFGEYPPDLMDVVYTGLVGSGEDQVPETMARLHNDQGLQSQAIMTLIYVQAALDLSGSKQLVHLPENFPEGWRELKPPLHDDHMTDTFDEFELNLSTSKMQRAVSEAFSRIGFEHVEELVITMEEMAGSHGINVSPKPIEILSVDIANKDARIAVEVDGPAHFVSRIDQHPTSGGGYSKLINGKLEYQFVWNGEQNEMNGATTLKQRLLLSLGWDVVNIPFWEWHRVAGDLAAEESYCRKCLERVK